jgi:hypothetical protein
MRFDENHGPPDLRVPVLLYCSRRVDDGTVHVEEEAVERYLLWRGGVIPGIVDAAHFRR